MDAANALLRFELENGIKELPAHEQDRIYKYDNVEVQRTLAAKPWTKDPHHFKKVKISAVALIKMIIHARSGGTLEVMGLLQGKPDGSTLFIMDSFALPVEGTETRVNAHEQAYEYMTNYVLASPGVGRHENAIGWYHSHPGYGCWLSGIDVSTEMLNQQHQDPYVAIVIDPNRTISAGKVSIGAFRTYPEDYKPPDDVGGEYQTIPLSKIEDFGVHSKRYYSLEVEVFRSSLDQGLLQLLWNKYWINTLSSSPLITNRDYTAQQIRDLAEKVDQAEQEMLQAGRGGFGMAPRKKDDGGQLSKVSKDGARISVEAAHGLMAQVLKNMVFNKPV
ncbi:JAB1/Mov34/MPN/PAD-1 ubiquitin protease-domain-containing protein [Zopfochytrium polystomum]|nr:JAB1/Mov34/MPN/PAD-1 ubiquitin protease-domain-containing protein [Zopfochytrium polystomum]